MLLKPLSKPYQYTSLLTLYPVLLAILLLIVIWVPQWEANRVITTRQTYQDRIAWFEIEHKSRAMVVQTMAGISLTMIALSALKTARSAGDERTTECFLNAIDMLTENDKLDVRIAGIYALEQIAKRSPADHWAVMEVLTTFVKQRPPLENHPADQQSESSAKWACPQDIQSALTVIGRRNIRKDNGRKIDLKNANLSGAELVRANLEGASLERADLRYADLAWADLRRANLYKANLSHADLTWASFLMADLSQTDLKAANLSAVDFRGAVLCEAKLAKANLFSANLTYACLNQNQLTNTHNWQEAIYDLNFAEKLNLDSHLQLSKAKEWHQERARQH